MKTVVIFGSRNITHYGYVYHPLKSLIGKDITVIHGGALGVDSLAERFCRENKIEYKVFKPDYSSLPGKIAPLERNRTMANHADYGIGIWDGVSRGTLHMKRMLEERNKPVEFHTIKNWDDKENE